MQRKLWILYLLTASLSFAQVNDGALNTAINQYNQGKYSEATESLRNILLDSDKANLQGDAYFWLGKVYVTTLELVQAEKNLEYFLQNFPNNTNYPEGIYQKGRLLFFQKEYAKAINVLTDFINKYPDSSLISNGHFWLGECFYETGHWEEAMTAYQVVIQQYPKSFKFEAAKYRVTLISLKRREEELLKLIKWSHEENLESLEEFQKREVEYRNAIKDYQNKLAILQSKNLENQLVDISDNLKSQEDQNRALQARIDNLEAENKALRTQLNSKDANIQDMTIQNNDDIQKLKALIDLKERVLKLKEFYYVELLQEGVQVDGQ
ncbi:tetratricopeptide repeat protein [Spirochaeta cellobiosiphila]|uniref:tetratricopeptide repeat protein n=1 Tax=Spirochaeta cellobiosiphila TaxID=504483 RepID=UPI0004231DB7|nr:tetratricopeptide repeat protein [Spirochaeta cellobiosiphila]